MVSISSGRIDRRLIISAEIPSSDCSFAAASIQKLRERECATIVTSVPSRRIFALPIGRRKSADRASAEIGNVRPY